MFALLLLALTNSLAYDNETVTHHLSLRAPWPAGLGRISISAARAVRLSPNASLVEFPASASSLRRLLAAGADVHSEGPDAATYYERRAAADSLSSLRRLAERRGPSMDVREAPPLEGSMAGYYTLAEVQAEMARLASAFPEWVGKPINIGTTREGRALELYCVADQQSACAAGSGRPAALFTALVHSREPATVMCVVHAVRELLKDAKRGVGGAARLLATRKVLLIPVANPDGYEWNRRARPKGGGMKRKNGMRSCNPPDRENDGVDLNRNFGFKWSLNSVGSSGRGCSEEYRGTAAFSEPETRAIRDVVRQHKPTVILHWHGWGNDIAFPYSYDWQAPLPAAQLEMYQEYSADMAVSNGYASGRAWESVGYTTNGEADDWGWGEMGAASLTLEVGSSKDGFWPPPSRILAIAEESVWPAKYGLLAAGPMMQLDFLSVGSAAPAEGRRVQAGTGRASLSLGLQNNGLVGFDGAHRVCAHSSPSVLRLLPSEGWAVEDEGKACLQVGPLKARASHAPPPLGVAWSGTRSHLELTLIATELPAETRNIFGRQVAPAAAQEALAVDTFRVKVRAADETLTGCDELCICPSVDPHELEYSHECRAALPAGSHCKVGKTARTGVNWASGVVDEHFRYTASTYTHGGTCSVSATARDALLAVYAECGRFGSLAVIGFANSEQGRKAAVSFPCAAGQTFDLFWNAEYVPGRHQFTVTETCTGAHCQRAHRRLRDLGARRAKKRRG